MLKPWILQVFTKVSGSLHL